MKDCPLLVFADDWGRHPSSCQHLVRRLREDHPILWVNTIGTRQVRADSITLRRGLEKIKSWSRGLTQVGERMWVVDLPMLPSLGLSALRQINQVVVAARLKQVLGRLGMARPLVLTTLPYTGWMIRGLPRRGLVYYCTDDYSHWPSADRETLQRAERELSGEADLILGASKALVARHGRATRCEYFPHGVDFAHFASAQRAGDAAEAVARLPRPRVGFFGLIYEKLDFALLASVARRFPNGSLVMIGPVAHCPAEFSAIPNVHLLGQVPYAELPRYIAGLDVLLLPYVIDDMIRQSGPLKLRECLASGKPTVSVDVAEVRILQPHVRVAADHESFVNEVQASLEEAADPALIRTRQLAVEQDGWDRRADLLRSFLAPLESAAGRNGFHPAGTAARRRVLHLRTISGKGGGPEKTLLNSPRFLAKTHDVRLAYVRPAEDPEYDMPARARKMGVELIDVPERGPLDPGTLWRLAREVRAFRPHILHAHDYKTNVLSVLLGRWFGIPVMTTMHGYVTRGGRLESYYLIDHWALRRMRHVVAVSDDLYRMLGELNVPPGRRTLIENAIDTEQCTRSRSVQDAKRRLGLRPAATTVGAVGRLSPEKGFDVLIRSADRLLREGMDVELLIVGDGPEKARLEQLAASLGRADRVRLLGHRDDALDLYQAFDIFALSSLREGLPNVLLEAMALETPVVATQVAGVPRVVEDGVNGLLVAPGDDEALSAALRRLAADPVLRASLASAGRRTVETRYSFAARMEKMRAVYDGLVGGDASVAAGQPEPTHVPLHGGVS